jgi:hypothetical protein
MRISALLAAAFLALYSSVAFADDAAAPKPGDSAIKLSPVALPIVVDGRIVNYVFATVVVDLTPSADSIALQEKEPMFRDALVRDAHRTPFVVAGDYNHLDEARLKAALYRDASAITGPGKVKGIEVQGQTAQHFIPNRRPGPPAASLN